MQSAFEETDGLTPIELTFIDEDETKKDLGFEISKSKDSDKKYEDWNIASSYLNPPNIKLLNLIANTTSEEILVKFNIYKKENFPLEYTQSFIVYAPENLALRNFWSETQIEPLGIHGEGLFKLISILNKEKGKKQLKEIKKNLQLIDWFEDFNLPKNSHFNERNIEIIDRYIHGGNRKIDQRSANEGFLYLLFYVTLFISKYTPDFFAIDNIDNALNPKLCASLMTVLTDLAKKHNKQVLLTTHNPSILDGIDLNDDEQRLFVVYRNLDGHTKVRRVQKKEMSTEGDSVKLSEAFLRGYIGGLNKF